MSLEAFRVLEQPGMAAIARDLDMRVLWTNDEFARQNGKTPAEMLGTTLHDILPAPLAEERIRMMEPAIRGERVVAYFQLWKGKRYLTRVWPLDPASFGVPGIFVVLAPWQAEVENTPYEDLPIVASPELAELTVLSRRELEVLYQLALGMSAKDIASRFFRSVSTIERHIESIHAKLGFSNRAEVVRFFVERGLLAFSEAQWQRFIQEHQG
ncbi:MAG: PAS domain-containing protein [Phycisphaeraceae bacterium]|nr:PAS domain-containing protein [Phycisphaeraceae bacterium]